MKILVSGHHNPLYLTFVEYFEYAIEELGYPVLKFDDRHFLFPGRLRHLLPFIQRMDLEQLNRKLLFFIKEARPNLVIITQGHFILGKTVSQIRALGIPVVLWVIDAPIKFAPILETAHIYSHIFCGGTESIVILKKIGISNLTWLPFACSPGFHFPMNEGGDTEKKFQYDVVFVGSHYPSREHLFQALSPFPYRFGIWGSGWEKLHSGSALRKHVAKTHTKPEEWIKIYSASKIVLVPHYSDPNIPCYQASPKIYEALACKAFVMCDNQPDIRALFKNREHLVIYEDVEDLKGKINFYLSHSEERAMIAQKGHVEALNKHTYTHRFQQILDTLRCFGIIS